MPRAFTLCLALLCATPLAWCQTDAITLNSNEPLILRTLNSVSSATAKVGDPIHFELIKPISVGDLTIIPAGAIANGKVVLAEKKRTRGRGGKLAITIEEIQAVTGEAVRLRAYDLRQEANKTVSNAVGFLFAPPIFPFGGIFIPAVLFMRGDDVFIGKGTRCTAVTDSTAIFDREALTRAQPAPKLPSPNVAELYIYRKEDKFSLDRPVAIGEKFVGNLDYGGGRFIHLRLRPGTYWLNSGEPNLETGRIRLNKEKPEHLFKFQFEGGKTYYIQLVLAPGKSFFSGIRDSFELIDDATGAEDILGLAAPGTDAIDPDAALRRYIIYREYLTDTTCTKMPNQTFVYMQVQPGAGDTGEVVIPGKPVECPAKLPMYQD